LDKTLSLSNLPMDKQDVPDMIIGDIQTQDKNLINNDQADSKMADDDEMKKLIG